MSGFSTNREAFCREPAQGKQQSHKKFKADITPTRPATFNYADDVAGNMPGDGANVFTYNGRSRLSQAHPGGVNTQYAINGPVPRGQTMALFAHFIQQDSLKILRHVLST